MHEHMGVNFIGGMCSASKKRTLCIAASLRNLTEKVNEIVDSISN